MLLVQFHRMKNQKSFNANYDSNFENKWPWEQEGLGSNYGRIDMIWAPGNNIDAARYNIDLTDKTFPQGGLNGTSFSNPFVTGVVALMKSRNPNLTPSEILSILAYKNFSNKAID